MGNSGEKKKGYRKIVTTEGKVFYSKDAGFFAYMWRHKALYLMLLPGLLYFILFRYVPMGDL